MLLNSEQSKAVCAISGPVLVLAGAGTGKTRVLVNRIAHIISTKSAFPKEILALTFSNKAAQEMRNRIQNLLGVNESSKMWIGTFHSIATKILRFHSKIIGIDNNFIIIDENDSLRLLQQIIDDYSFNNITPRIAYDLINQFKDKLYLPLAVPKNDTQRYPSINLIYIEYQKRLEKSSALDFSDLLLYVVKLFNHDAQLSQYYQQKFKYILVDEYQDTSFAQYAWLRILSQHHRNICCVGDDDQSIYGWRGAVLANILRFDIDFPGATVISLCQNYRSTPHILGVANGLIANNQTRNDKELRSNYSEGEKVKLHIFYDDREEANKIASYIFELQSEKTNPSIAILLRASHQMRLFEDNLNILGVKYKVIGGIRFYERAEIKDLLSYARILVNPNDDLAFERVINTPKRGIGSVTLEQIRKLANKESISLVKAGQKLCNDRSISNIKGLQSLINHLLKWQKLANTISPSKLMNTIIEDIDYWSYIEKNSKYNFSNRDKAENVKELLNSLSEFNDLTQYIQYILTVGQEKSIEEGEIEVQVMTMHAAKGSEFDIVFLPGWEEGIFPSAKSLDEQGTPGLEEERRLGYVAITRAKKHLHISYVNNRRMFGSYLSCVPSRFLRELNSKHYMIVNHIINKQSNLYNTNK